MSFKEKLRLATIDDAFSALTRRRFLSKPTLKSLTPLRLGSHFKTKMQTTFIPLKKRFLLALPSYSSNGVQVNQTLAGVAPLEQSALSNDEFIELFELLEETRSDTTPMHIEMEFQGRWREPREVDPCDYQLLRYGQADHSVKTDPNQRQHGPPDIAARDIQSDRKTISSNNLYQSLTPASNDPTIEPQTEADLLAILRAYYPR